MFKVLQGHFDFPLKERIKILFGASAYFEFDDTMRRAVVAFKPPAWIGAGIGKTRKLPEC